MASGNSGKTQVVVTCNSQQAQAALKAMQAEANRLTASLKRLQQAGLGNTKQFQDEKKALKDVQSTMKQLQTNTELVSKVMGDLSNASLRQLKSALREVKKQMQSMSGNSPELKSLQEKYTAINNQINRITGNINGAKKASSAWSTTLRNMTAYFGAFQVFSFVTDKLKSIVTLNLKFSDQLADIRKVSGLAMKDVNQLSQNLAKIDTRTSIQELNTIAYEGAKLGIPDNYGMAGLEQFTKAANQVNVALREELGQDALTALSKITEVMGLIPKMGVEKAMLSTASAMFQLSASSTSSANNIVEFAKRLTGMARTAGVTTDQLLSLGSAADSMYLMPEVAATAFSKLFAALQTNHNLIEKALSIPPGTINQLYTAGKTMDAVVLILEKMKEKGNMNALGSVFKDLGSDGARLVNVMVTMANNVDMLKSHLDVGAEAFREGTAVTKEYMIQQETAQALMERASNIWEKSFVNPDGVDSIQKMARAWYDLSVSFTQNEVSMGLLKGLLQVIFWNVRQLITLMPALLAGLMIKGVAAAWQAVRSSINMTNGSITASTLATQGLAAAWRTLNAAQKANVIALVISLVASLAIEITNLVKWVKSLTSTDVQPWMDGFTMSMKDFNAEFEEGKSKLDRFKKAIEEAAQGTNQRRAAIANFNKEFGPYLTKMLTEKATAQDLADAYKEVVTQMRAKLALQGKQKDIEKFVAPRQSWEADRLSEYGETVKGTNNSQYNASWLKGFVDDRQGKGVWTIAKELNDSVFHLRKEAFDKIYSARGGEAPAAYDRKVMLSEIRKLGKGEKDRPVKTETYAIGSVGKQLHAALAYILQAKSTVNAEKKVNEKWAPYEDDINNYIAGQYDTSADNGSLDNLATDKEAEKARKKAEAEAKKKAREELQAAKKDRKAAVDAAQEQANGIINNIEEYYKLQDAAITEAYNRGEMVYQQSEAIKKELERKKNLMLQQARYAISGRDNNFDELRKQMGPNIDQYDFGSNSTKALGIVKNTDTDALYRLLSSLVAKPSEEKEGFASTRAFLEEIAKNAAENARKAADESAKQKHEVEKYLNENDYVKQAYDKLWETLQNDGLNVYDNKKVFYEAARMFRERIATKYKEKHGATISDDELDKLAGFTLPERANELTVEQMSAIQRATGNNSGMTLGEIPVIGTNYYKARKDMFSQFLTDSPEHFTVDPRNENATVKWFQQFVSNGKWDDERDYEGNKENLLPWTYSFPDMAEWLKEPAEHFEEIQKLLLDLTKGEEEYYDAVKKRTDWVKKNFETRWQRTSEYRENQKKQDDVSTFSSGVAQFGVPVQQRKKAGEKIPRKDTYGTSAVIDSFGYDPEVEAYRLKMEAAAAYYDYLKKRGDDAQAIRDAERSVLQSEMEYAKSVAAQMKQRMADIYALMSPIEEFGTNVGEAFATMTEDAEAGRAALKQATGDMINSMMKQTVQIMQELIKRRMFQMINDRLTSTQMKKAAKEQTGIESEKQEEITDTQKEGGSKKQSIFKKLGKTFSKLFKKEKKTEVKQEEQKQEEVQNVQEEGAAAKEVLTEDVQTETLNVTKEIGQQTLQQEKTQTQESVQTKSSETQAKTTMGIAEGAAEIIGKLGWWGIPLVAVITALLNGLLSMAMSKVSSLFGGGSDNSSDSGSSAKLVSGMLTYDSGNVQAFSGVDTGKTYPVVGNDGKVYAAKDGGELSTGLVRDPITTILNGQPALVAERGPEMVIGRETTAAMMMARPDLLSEIVKFDRSRSGQTYRAYDSGNVADVAAAVLGEAPTAAAGLTADDVASLRISIADFTAMMLSLQKTGLHVNKYGRGGVVNAAADGANFMRKNSGDRLWRSGRA